MGDAVACLRGWHPALGLAELEALLPEAKVGATEANRWWTVSGCGPDLRSEALSIASSLQCFLTDGIVAGTQGISPEGWIERMITYLEAHPVEGTVAVRSWRQGGKIPEWSLTHLTQRLGGVLTRLGYSVDLEAPDHTLALIADGPHQALACGWMEGDGQSAFSNGERRAGERPFFKPVSLDPMLARLAVNLACGPKHNGPVVDPMTGTGGFLIEASLSGRDTLAMDIHSEMVQGASNNLAWAHGDVLPTHATVVRGDATRIEAFLPQAWKGSIAGFVLDPPYGRNSHGSVDPHRLLEGCLLSARRVAAPSAGFVLILPVHPLEPHSEERLPMDGPYRLLHGEWSEVMGLIECCGWRLESVHAERVHRSLSRLILHARCAPQD